MLSGRLTTEHPHSVEWLISHELIAYPEAVRLMEARVASIIEGKAPELVWLLEHPPLYTAGASARDHDLLEARFPVFRTGRGGQYTYHGPGQRVVYLMLDLKQRGSDVRAYVRNLENWLIEALSLLGVRGETRAGRVGIWIAPPGEQENKIAAIGVRVRKWVAYHGISLNVAPDLSHYAGIVPCGIAAGGGGVTSLRALGLSATMPEVDAALRTTFGRRFGPSV
jgi:lipoyl(octanoyl) transferase